MKYSWKIIAPISAILGAAALWYGVRRVAGAAEPVMPLGVSHGQLTPCPESPNCVATTSLADDQQMPPLPLRGDPQQSLARLRAIVGQHPRSKLVVADGNYLHFEIRSKWFGFIDDVEFLAVPEQGEIHFRSASRTGYSDLGVNQARMENIAADYLAE